MKPSSLKSLLSQTIPAGLSILITGAPGIGKSDIVAEATSDAGYDMIISHPVVSDPTDAKGLPWANKNGKEATFLPFGELAQAIDAKNPTVWFLDDLGQAKPAVQASFMQLILARRVNGHKLPDCVTFIAATNRRTDRAGVTGILEPVKSRFASIVSLEADVDDWCEWAIGAAMPIELIAFIRFRGNPSKEFPNGLLHDFQPSADLTNSPSPRTWANVGRLVTLRLQRELEIAAINGAVGEGAGTEFISYAQMYRNLPSLDSILTSPDTAPIPSLMAARYAVATGLAGRATTTNIGRVITYANRLMQAEAGDFSVLMMRDCVRRNSDLCVTEPYIKMTSSPLGKLVSGE